MVCKEESNGNAFKNCVYFLQPAIDNPSASFAARAEIKNGKFTCRRPCCNSGTGKSGGWSSVPAVQLIKFAVTRMVFHQCRVCALHGDFSFIQKDDLIHFFHPGQMVSNENHRFVL